MAKYQVKLVQWAYAAAGLLLGVALWLLITASVGIAHTNNQTSSGAVDAVGVIGILLSLATMGLGGYAIYVIYTESYMLTEPTPQPIVAKPKEQPSAVMTTSPSAPSTPILQSYPQLQL